MSKIKTRYTPQQGLFQESTSKSSVMPGFEIDSGESENTVTALKVTRGVIFNTSKASGISEPSGSLLSLKGKQEGLYFHLGGNQYISNNSWFDADLGGFGSWRYETTSGAAFRWGFRSSAGVFDLDYGPSGEEDSTVSFATSLSMTASNGGISIGKKASTGLNGTFDITGSINAKPGLVVTGSVDIGGGSPDAFFAPPRHTNTTRDVLTAMEGMIIYNITTHKLNYYNGTAWRSVDDSAI